MSSARLTSDLITRPRGNEQRRRSLVLSDESARHPFRALLPPTVKRDLIPILAEDLWRLKLADVRGVASTYVAATAAILVFII